MRNPIDLRGYARPLRIVAILVAICSAVWEVFSGGVPHDVLSRLLVVRAVETSVAVAVAILATSRRSLPVLRVLIWVLALDVVGANAAVVAVVPSGLWEALLSPMAVVMGAALFAPWSWRWQAGLVVVVIAGALLVLWLWVPLAGIAPWSVPRVVLSLTTIGLASVLGAHLIDLDRRQVLASELRYRGLFDAAGDAIAVLDAAGFVREGNTRLADLLDREIEDLPGCALGEALTITGADGREVELRPLLATLTDTVLVTGVLRLADGSGRPVEVSLSLLQDPSDRQIQAILRDTTIRQVEEQRAALAERYHAVGRFAGTMAHQFNNLLAGILTQTTLLEDEAPEPDASGLREIANAVRRGEHLTKALLRFTPHYAVTARPQDPLEVLRRAAEVESSAAGAALGVWAAPDLPPLAGDADHLVDALVELVRNAREATKDRPDAVITLSGAVEDVAEGDVRWRGAVPGRYIRLSVIDQGVGMDPETVEQLFEPFFTTKPLHEATGVGMSAVYWVARAHGGVAAVDSQPGHGTSVHLIVPVWTGPNDRLSTEKSAPVPSEGASRPATVLVVDDESFIRNTAQRALERFGYTVLTADDGDAGFAILARAHPPVDLAILDVVMPAGGAGLAERMLAIQPDLPILVWSGYGPSGEVERMMNAGAQGFLQKPYEIPELRDAVAAALDGRLCG